jgi:hypothetical protein
MYKHQITIEIDETMLASYTNEYLATCWHLAQVNPADSFASSVPGDLTERIGREIIRRWLGEVSPELWHHQGKHYYWHELQKLAKYEPGGVSGSPEWHEGTWVPRTDAAGDAKACPRCGGTEGAWGSSGECSLCGYTGSDVTADGAR